MARCDPLYEAKENTATFDTWLEKRSKSLTVDDIMLVVKKVAEILKNMHEDGLTLGSWDPTGIVVHDENVSRITAAHCWTDIGAAAGRCHMLAISDHLNFYEVACLFACSLTCLFA